jgi:hypothetical protein
MARNLLIVFKAVLHTPVLSAVRAGPLLMGAEISELSDSMSRRAKASAPAKTRGNPRLARAESATANLLQIL